MTEKIDGVQLLGEPLSYAPGSNPMLGPRHLRNGSYNLWQKVGMGLTKRPGLVANGNALGAGHVPYHMEISENGTIALSVFHTASGEYRVMIRKSGGSFVQITTVHPVSETPHEFVWVRNLLYVRSDNAAAGSKYAGLVYNETDDNVDFWGLERPDTAPAFTADSGWNSSGSDTVAPILGARYAYTWVSRLGHESSRSPFTDLSAVVSGKYPAMNVQGHAETTLMPNINIYRSGDGGGGLFFIEQIANTGAGSILYEDTNFSPGGNFATGLDITRPSPTRNSNTAVPTVESGEIGTDPVERSSPLAFYGGRVWLAVGRNLYYSSNDESIPRSGLLEHSFRLDGTASASQISFNNSVKHILATRLGLIIWTAKDTFVQRGVIRSDIVAKPLYERIGILDRHCADSFGDSFFWIDQDYEVRASSGTSVPLTISQFLDGEIKTLGATGNYLIELRVIKLGPYDLLVVHVGHNTDLSNSRQFIYDINRQIWFTPWRIPTRSIGEFGTFIEFDDVSSLDIATTGDLGGAYAAAARFSLEKHPAGNLVNLRRTETLITPLHYVEVEHEGAEGELTVAVRQDSLSTSLSTTKSNPGAAPDPTGYTKGYYQLNRLGERFAVDIDLSSTVNAFDIHSIRLGFEPSEGD